MKYAVLVNNKYMVAVEKDGSAAAAEHEILDNYFGISGAQAFGKADMKTNYFNEVFQMAELISLKDLQKMSDEVKRQLEILDFYKSAKRDAEKRVERLRQELADAEETLRIADAKVQSSEIILKETEDEIGYKGI